ncbi:hypothetical protein JCM17380_37010 [Desulfosporosinus burensis]
MDDIEPILGVLIPQNIALSSINHPGSIYGVNGNRNKYDNKFNDKNPRETPHGTNNFVIQLWPTTGG